MSEPRATNEVVYPLDGREPFAVINEHLKQFQDMARALGPEWMVEASIDLDTREVGLKCVKPWA